MQKILIVCVGNICRSPMGEALLKHNLDAAGIEAEISSAGISALSGHSATKFAQELMLEKQNINISNHQAQQITPYMITNVDLVLVMETGHKDHILKMAPQARGKVFTVGKWQNIEIADPYKQSKETFEACFNEIQNCMLDWEKRLWKNSSKLAA